MNESREIAAVDIVVRLVREAATLGTYPEDAELFTEAADEIEHLRSLLRLAEFKIDILTNNEAVHLERLRKVDPEWVAAEARIAETEAWWEANGKAELIAHLREQGLTLASGDVQ